MKFCTLLLASFLVPGVAVADTHQTGRIVRIVVESNFASVRLENQPTNTECASDGRWVIDFSNDQAAREKYSAILSAANSRQPVSFHYLSSQGCGGFGAKKIYYVDASY